jgi:cyclic pyranopterin phosphate synthase
MPEAGVKPKSHQEILSYEEIEAFAKAAVKAGISRIRLTGGEPLVRRDIVSLVEMLSGIEGLKDVSLTTNGVMLPRYGKALKKAGLNRVNISLDSLDPVIYRRLTRLGDVNRVLEGLKVAIELGFDPVKINVVLIRGVNDDPYDFIKLIHDYPVHVRFIELMPVSISDFTSYIPIDEFKTKVADCINNRFGKSAGVGANMGSTVAAGADHDKLIRSGMELKEIDSSNGKPYGAGPAHYVTVEGAKGSIGFINAISNHFCDRCNRIRLTADGKLRPCLFSNTEFDVREQLRLNKNEEDLAAFIGDVIRRKPERHGIADDGVTITAAATTSNTAASTNVEIAESTQTAKSAKGVKSKEAGNMAANIDKNRRLMSQIGG